MDKIQKALERFTSKEKKKVKEILVKLKNQQLGSLDIKKLKGREDIFRVRKGRIRIVYKTDQKGNIFILTIERRSDTIYNAIS
jgi:mRNA-degrading endonuclease RelE of RelBE toxin-antitoxin system